VCGGARVEEDAGVVGVLSEVAPELFVVDAGALGSYYHDSGASGSAKILHPRSEVGKACGFISALVQGGQDLTAAVEGDGGDGVVGDVSAYVEDEPLHVGVEEPFTVHGRTSVGQVGLELGSQFVE